jgi:hypothetical protein
VIELSFTYEHDNPIETSKSRSPRDGEPPGAIAGRPRAPD